VEPDLPEIRVDGTPSERISYQSNSFYQRESPKSGLIVAGRNVKPVRNCLICSFVPRLMEKGYTFYEAVDAEQDLYRFIYTFWTSSEISRWLKRTYDYEASHDSVSRHINKHIPDPNLAMLDRVKGYKPNYMNKAFFNNLADTMKLYIMRYQAGIATGSIPLNTNDFITVAKTLKDWQGFLSEMQGDKTDMFMDAIGKSIEKTLAPYPEVREAFIATFREELAKIDKEQEDDFDG
jgi:hypothetical protein